tara:strand:- start:839 stop:1384 length:546 start_codon:yes stop_codon:yes gene_type:complete
MAKNQFNAWEPVLDGLEGNFQAEPRVFAHDAKTIVIGAVNTSAGDGGVSKLISGGTGYALGSGVATTGGAGTGLTVNILTVDTGVITSFEVAAVGSGYVVGNTITISTGGANATFTITNIDIPNTQKRGCCVYIGAGGNMSVIMESGSSAIQFTGLSSGTFLPILIKRVTAATATDLIALY